MLVIVVLIHLSTLFSFVGAASIWSQIQAADFTFAKGQDNGARDTKPIVHAYIKNFGVNLGNGHYGLLITPGKPDLLDNMADTLQGTLTSHTSTPLINTILADPQHARKNVVATTENDYTHALHGMFMLVMNTMMDSEPFATLLKRYRSTVQLLPGNPTLGAQRSARSHLRNYFFPDWLVSFPATARVLEAKEVLSTVEFKMGGNAFQKACDLHDSFFASGGTAAAIWAPAAGIKEGVIHYVPIDNGVALRSRLDEYDTLFDRILEAAATALWTDTKLTLFAASSRYFAAGPAAGYGHLKKSTSRRASVQEKRDDLNDAGVSTASVDKTRKIAAARAAFRKNKPVDAEFVSNALSNTVPVRSKVIYLPTYGTSRKPATFLAHVLALTMDKLANSVKESKRDLDHSAPISKKHDLVDPKAADRPPKQQKLDNTLCARGSGAACTLGSQSTTPGTSGSTLGRTGQSNTKTDGKSLTKSNTKSNTKTKDELNDELPNDSQTESSATSSTKMGGKSNRKPETGSKSKSRAESTTGTKSKGGAKSTASTKPTTGTKPKTGSTSKSKGTAKGTKATSAGVKGKKTTAGVTPASEAGKAKAMGRSKPNRLSKDGSKSTKATTDGRSKKPLAEVMIPQ